MSWCASCGWVCRDDASCGRRRRVDVPDPHPITPDQAATDGAMVVMGQRLAAMEQRVLVLEARVAELAKLCGAG